MNGRICCQSQNSDRIEGPCSCLRNVSGVDEAEPDDGIEAKLDWVCDEGRRPLSDPIPKKYSNQF